MARYLDPKSDLIFKKVFGKHPQLLKSFLNAILPLPQNALIERLEYLSPENVPDIPNVEKRSVVDVRCYDQQGRHFIVEMQMAWSKHFMRRFLFNTASVYVRQLRVPEDFGKLNPVYGLAIVAQAFSEENNWFHHYRLAHNQNNDNIIEDFHLILLELPKFEPQSLQDKKLTALWMRFMTEIDERTRNVDQALLDVPEIREALTLIEEAAYTPEELDAYLRNWDAIKTQRMLMNDTLEEGFEKGMEKGIEKGMEKGIEKGMEKGKKEERYAIAKKSLAKGWDVQTVSEITELSVEMVEQIRTIIIQK